MPASPASADEKSAHHDRHHAPGDTHATNPAPTAHDGETLSHRARSQNPDRPLREKSPGPTPESYPHSPAPGSRDDCLPPAPQRAPAQSAAPARPLHDEAGCALPPPSRDSPARSSDSSPQPA